MLYRSMQKILLIISVLLLTGSIVYYYTSSEKEEEQIAMNRAILETNQGNITIELLPDKAPNTVDNFVRLANEGFYDGTRFHRVIEDFMVQGGDPLSKSKDNMGRWGTGGPGYTFDDEENDVQMVQGVLAMANSGPNTNGSQFFIITAEETPWLQGRHTAFGRVTEGMDVVMAIQSMDTGPNDIPEEDVILQKVTIE